MCRHSDNSRAFNMDSIERIRATPLDFTSRLHDGYTTRSHSSVVTMQRPAFPHCPCQGDARLYVAASLAVDDVELSGASVLLDRRA